MNNEELISTLHDKAQALNFETRWLIFEALKRLEVLTETTKRIKSPSGEMAELKPCPYCGKKAEMKVDKHPCHGFDYTPRCSDPSCAGRLTKKWASKEKAIYAWNRRADNG